MYHRVLERSHGDQLIVSAERFEQQMRWLAAHASPTTLDTVFEMVCGTQPTRSAVAVTFDDGYLDNLTHALPILRKYGIPAVIFATTSFADGTRSHPRYAGSREPIHLNWTELAALGADPLIEIGSHTCTHRFLRRLDEVEARREIVDSKRYIEERLGRAVRWFCYPSGDFGPREAALVVEAGYLGAVSVAPGANRRGTSVTELRRTEMTDRDFGFDLRLKLDGAFDPFHRVLHWRRERQFRVAAELAP
jgi:peptidoglycan/xylan/chitin deacetylase (PgdA/CDA1 family)